MMTSVDLLRALHVTAAVLLLGNVTVTGFWAIFLYRVRDTVPFRQVARAILWADFYFTALGGTLLVITGFLLLNARGLSFLRTWGECHETRVHRQCHRPAIPLNRPTH